MAQVCRFFQMGNCKYGDSCRFDHPGASRDQSSNRFSNLSNSSSHSPSTNSAFPSLQRNTSNNPRRWTPSLKDNLPYGLSTEVIERDLRSEAPQWILSAYGPGRDAPEQLFGGYPREQSFEEIRQHYENGLLAGRPEQALNDIQSLYQSAREQMADAASNVNEAVRFILEAEEKHPNRIDITKQSSPNPTTGEFLVGKRLANKNANAVIPFTLSMAAPLAQPSQPAAGFGAPLAQSPGGFGTPSLGQPTQPSAGFGTASQPVSAFGQPSRPAAGFGQPPFGQPAGPTGGFGQASQQNPGGNAFGQPSALGQRANAFGQPAFGQSAQPGAAGPAFGQPAFGKPAQPGAAGPAFGQPSSLGQNLTPFGATNPNGGFSAFANAQSAQSPFAQAAAAQAVQATQAAQAAQAAQAQAAQAQAGQNTTMGDATTSPFGRAAQSTTPFGAPSPSAPTNPFASAAPAESSSYNPFASAQRIAAQNTTMSNSQPQQTPFGQTQQTAFGRPPPIATQSAQPQNAEVPDADFLPPDSPYPPDSDVHHPELRMYASHDKDGKLLTWTGLPVHYRNGLPGVLMADGGWIQVSFPDGPPSFQADTQGRPGEYTPEILKQWESFARTGRFDKGIVPLVPPLRVHCLWNL